MPVQLCLQWDPCSQATFKGLYNGIHSHGTALLVRDSL